MSNTTTAVVIGAGPGLGMSIAHRFGRAGHRVALVSRGIDRHPERLEALAADGIDATAFPADVMRPGQIASTLDAITERLGDISVLYNGIVPTGDGWAPENITDTTSDVVRSSFDLIYPSVDAVHHVLPGMVERGNGTLLFGSGLSGVRPMPQLGGLALMAAAVRHYALTLNAALADKGVYAGVLSIGAMIERSAVHDFVVANADNVGEAAPQSINPDEIADAAWEMAAKRDRGEEVFEPRG
ncbi:MAG TPA: SDR family NAD(P)-dependent oxidoreductase [Stackebrandtia sp.]|jgi:NADP-dependent 3-hydroxy acid dehydrogenase YdfG|uniref:SDR family NAD(P)-dependent oxidoreductase n=1 Tax=Stackebrandtia sp. TaxID=2023065 RepID=UPI002D6ED11A|nr:SDR family NAD(P)-dependent oxidoreductase [Stackebrandtia sp.]HZE39661.1 SDR family NAD(P)-dependent oxidoreductase [Stackebrandtia sp.]